jgi:hypothetical protein
MTGKSRLTLVRLMLTATFAFTAGCASNTIEGDPGGRVLRALLPVARAVPPGSGTITTTSRSSEWGSACPDNPGGRAGWSPVTVLTAFVSSLSQGILISDVNMALSRDGWKPAMPRDDAQWQYTPIAEWTKPVHGATSADVVVFPFSATSTPPQRATPTRWMLGAEGKTPGYALPGC